MACESQRLLVRSFAPEWWLTNRRDVNGLWRKYRAGLPNGSRLLEIVRLNASIDPQVERHGSVIIDAEHGSYVSGMLDNDRQVELHDDRVISLHIDPFDGVNQLRSDIADVATSIQDNEDLSNRQWVMGVTYKEMAQLAMRAGFQSVEVTDVCKPFEYAVEASHLVFCALNNRRSDFELSAVHMPTDEFVSRFAGVGSY